VASRHKLIEAAAGTICGLTLRRELADVFAVQDEIYRSHHRAIAPRHSIAAEIRTGAAQRPGSARVAWDRTVHPWAHWHISRSQQVDIARSTPAASKKAIDLEPKNRWRMPISLSRGHSEAVFGWARAPQ